MPRKADAQVLGRCDCPECGDRMAVLQNAKNYLYSRCPKCGCDQRNGKPVQTYLWYKTAWIDGEPDVKPRNVPDDNPFIKKESVQEPKGEPSEPEKSLKKQSSRKIPAAGLLLVPIGIILAIAARA